MNKFSQFDIILPAKGFEGEKIRMERIMDVEITVHDYRIEESKIKSFRDRGSGRCLYLQISFRNELHVVFTSSAWLIASILQISKDKFPFTTIIIKENKRFKFT